MPQAGTRASATTDCDGALRRRGKRFALMAFLADFAAVSLLRVSSLCYISTPHIQSGT